MIKNFLLVLLSFSLLLPIMVLSISAGYIKVPGQVGRINITLYSSQYQYTADDFPGIDIEKIDQFGTSLTIVINEKTEEATDIAMEQIKIILNGKYRYIIQDYNNIYVYSDGSDSVIHEGDVNLDGNVNITDVSLLLKYIAKWDVSLKTDAVDVTDDGKVNISDASLLLKYIAKWDVVLK